MSRTKILYNKTYQQNNFHTRFHQIVDEIKVFVTDLVKETKLAVGFLNNNGYLVIVHDGVTRQIGDEEQVKFTLTDYK